uniref:Uncharacterized protein n=1 Tax=Corvus moneduloides TaxID=1196302 RepID=A0A8C3GV65_CORMO
IQSFPLISLNASIRFLLPLLVLFQVVGEVYGVMACFPQRVCFTLPYAINCRWIWDILINLCMCVRTCDSAEMLFIAIQHR